MGVKGLWQLVLPIGRRVSIETLEGKVLAIDLSIWWTQFLSVATKRSNEHEATGGSSTNTSSVILIGFLRRICKLLYHGIRPVMVLDGSTPQIKLRELQRRRRHRQELSLTSETSTQQLAKRIFLQQLRKKKKQATSQSSGPKFHLPEEEEEEEKEVFIREANHTTTSSVKRVNNDSAKSNNQNETSMSQDKITNHNDLAIAQALQEEEYNKTNTATVTGFDNDEVDDDEVESIDQSNVSLFGEEEEEEEENVLNLTKEWNVDTIGSLSMSERKELFESAQKNQRYKSRRQLLNKNTDPSNYSQTQISNFLQSSQLNQTIATLSKQITNRNNNNNNHAGFLTTTPTTSNTNTNTNNKNVEVLPLYATKLKSTSSSTRKKRRRFDPTIWTYSTTTNTPTTPPSASKPPIELNYDECFNAVTTYKNITTSTNNNEHKLFFNDNNNNIHNISNKRNKIEECQITTNNTNSMNDDGNDDDGDDDLSQSSNMDEKPKMNTKLISSEFHFMNSDAEGSSSEDENDIQSLLRTNQPTNFQTNSDNVRDSDDDEDNVDWEDGNDNGEEDDTNQTLPLKDKSEPQRGKIGIVTQASSFPQLPYSNQQINLEDTSKNIIYDNTEKSTNESKPFLIREETSAGGEIHVENFQREQEQQQQMINLELNETKEDKATNKHDFCSNKVHVASNLKEELVITCDSTPVTKQGIEKINNAKDERITKEKEESKLSESKLDDSNISMCNEKYSVIEEESKENINTNFNKNKVQNHTDVAFDDHIVNHMNDDKSYNVSSFVQNLQDEVFEHEQQTRHQRDLDNNNITAEDMKEDIIQLLQLFGIPYVQVSNAAILLSWLFYAHYFSCVVGFCVCLSHLQKQKHSVLHSNNLVLSMVL